MTTNPAPITEAPLTAEELDGAEQGFTRIGDRNAVGVVTASGLNTVAYLDDLPSEVRAALQSARVHAQVTGSMTATYIVKRGDRTVIGRWIAEGHERRR